MIGAGLLKKLVGAPVGALGVAVGGLRHAAWYVRYQADGTARDERPAPERDRSGPA